MHFHKRSWRSAGWILLLGTAFSLVLVPAAAEKPPRPDKMAGDAAPRVLVEVQLGSFFVDSQRAVVRSYYAPRVRTGKCPPGLAKKNNGCLPPGQAKNWQIGQPLPPSVVFYPLPRAVTIRIGLPPPGHAYVRVAADILLIAIGTRLVIDAIEDLGGL